jgi:hypothetical protein
MGSKLILKFLQLKWPYFINTLRLCMRDYFTQRLQRSQSKSAKLSFCFV